MQKRGKIPPEQKQRGIYLIVNHANGKVYVGSTGTSFYTRWKQHQTDLRNNRHGNPYLQAAWNKYGEPMFEFMILECINEINSIRTAEQFYLDIFFGNGNYNIASTVDGNQPDLKPSLYRKIYLIDPNGNKYGPITNVAAFARERGWTSGGLANLINGITPTYYGWKVTSVNEVRRKQLSGRPKDRNAEEAVLYMNQIEPCSSLRYIAELTGVHYISVRNILKRYGLDYRRENCATKLTMIQLKKQLTPVS